MAFVNREEELRVLNEWWARPGQGIALVWGRRRVGKTALIERFASDKQTVFHVGTHRPVVDELAVFATAAWPHLGEREVTLNPFRDWGDAIETVARAAAKEPLLLVLDEFPELVAVAPELPSVLRAAWDRLRSRTKLRVLLCGSAVRSVQAMREERAPLYGRFDLQLLIHPLRSWESALFLRALEPAERARVWGIVGGVPLYLQWWDPSHSVRENLLRLACTPGGPLLSEGQLVLATEADEGDLARQVLHAIAAGRTKHNEIADAVRADPTRTLERLVELRLVERIVPVTEDARRTRRRIYRIADNFLAFWLGVLDRYRAEIERGLGKTVIGPILEDLDDHMGPRWEQAFRDHLRRLALAGELGDDVVAVGPFWTAVSAEPNEIDAVVLSGRSREAILVGEAKWARTADGQREERLLRAKARALPRARDEIEIAVCAREEVRSAGGIHAFTARDLFS